MRRGFCSLVHGLELVNGSYRFGWRVLFQSNLEIFRSPGYGLWL